MRRVCLIVEDQVDLRPVLVRMLQRVFSRAWGPAHGIEVIAAATCDEGLERLIELSGDTSTHCVLVTDYDLGDGRTGSELILKCQQLFGSARSIQVLLSGTLVSDLIRDPVVRELPRASLLAKPLNLHQLNELLPQMAAIWRVSLKE